MCRHLDAIHGANVRSHRVALTAKPTSRVDDRRDHALSTSRERSAITTSCMSTTSCYHEIEAHMLAGGVSGLRLPHRRVRSEPQHRRRRRDRAVLPAAPQDAADGPPHERRRWSDDPRRADGEHAGGALPVAAQDASALRPARQHHDHPLAEVRHEPRRAGHLGPHRPPLRRDRDSPRSCASASAASPSW